jgi:ATP-dependent Clp protease ATP-binding subunit ClpB
VAIGEGAIVAAVTLAKRYLSDRALPDTAVDLLDETSARKRVEIDGVPAEADAMIRRAESLDAQIATLPATTTSSASRPGSASRRSSPSSSAKVADLKQQISARAASSSGAHVAQGALRRRVKAYEQAKRDKNFAKMGELEHVTIPDMKKRRLAAEQAAAREGGRRARSYRPRERRGRDARRLDGHPGKKMLEGESEKLLKMEERLANAGRRSRRGGARDRQGGAPRPRGPARPGQAHRLLPVPRPERRRKDRAREGARRVPLRRRAALTRST